MKLYTICLLAMAGSARATILDSFTPRDHSQNIVFGGAFEGGHSVTASFLAPCVGGERDIELFQAENTALPGPRFYAAFDDEFGGFLLGGDGTASPGNGTAGHAILQYDGVGDELDNIGRDKRLRNGGTGVPLFNGADGGVRIWYKQFDANDEIPVTVTLRRLGQELASRTVIAGFSSDLTSISFPFSEAEFGAADSMSIKLNADVQGPGSTQTLNLFLIDTIVPEPGTYLALGGGIAWLAAHRRKRAV